MSLNGENHASTLTQRKEKILAIVFKKSSSNKWEKHTRKSYESNIYN